MKNKFIKKILFSLFVLMLFLIENNSVKGIDCEYIDEDYIINVNFDQLSEDENPLFSFGGESGYQFYIGNFYFCQNVTAISSCNFFSNGKDDYFTKDFVDEQRRCPDYLYMYNSDGYLYGYFSDKANHVDFAIQKPEFKFKSNALEIEEDENGDLVPTEERYSCSLKAINYNFETTVQINYTQKTMSFSNGNFEKIESYQSEFDYTNKNECLKDLKVCYKKATSDSERNRRYFISKRDDMTYDDSAHQCYYLEKKGDVEVGTNYCSILHDKLILNYNNKLAENNYSEANENLNKVKEFCRVVVANSNYDSYKYSCIDTCLNIQDYIPNLKIEDGAYCGFSGKLITWVANIIKWGKYLIPVIVIVLGILDFIKAIAADKEDEMKKAQGRFVKRLIAAALIFIVPFIIEFILDKLGFDAFGCGIIDL
ncbi:MAG: hypothetical protein E7174_01330 [Firmicutes bacterium]|nr:hypothetical protein [Bacillota bacterium]